MATKNRTADSKSRREKQRKNRRTRWLRCEQLEDRRLLTSCSEMTEWLTDAQPMLEHQSQVFYLDFDGASDVTYNGPITVSGIDVPPFSAERCGLAGREDEIIARLIRELNDDFGEYGMVFTIEYPDDDGSHSTIYVGGDDSRFAEYGSFLGVAEQVDEGNADPQDIALVFSDSIFMKACGSPFPTSLPEVTGLLSEVIAHEAAHLVGFHHGMHAAANTSPLSDVAMFDYPLSSRFGWGVGPSQHFGGHATSVNPKYVGHLATDIPAVVGAPVYAVADGKITQAANGGTGWGNFVIIEHKTTGAPWFWLKDVYSMYAHVNFLPGYTTGKWVSRGEQIATIASYSSGSHLHFEIRDAYDVPSQEASWRAGPGYTETSTWNRFDRKTIYYNEHHGGVYRMNHHDPDQFLANNPVASPNLVSQSSIVQGQTLTTTWHTTGGVTHVGLYLYKGNNPVDTTPWGGDQAGLITPVGSLPQNGSPQSGRLFNWTGSNGWTIPSSGLIAGSDYRIRVIAWDRAFAPARTAVAYTNYFAIGNADIVPPTVTGMLPASGSSVSSGPTEILINFSEAMGQSSGNLAPGDLTLGGAGKGGAYVTSANWVDADTARFVIAGIWGTGQVTTQLLGGWPKDLAGNDLVAFTSGLFTITETERPTASLSVANITGGGGTTHNFTVTYADNVAIDVGSLDSNDILVTGPNSYSQTATFVSVNNTTNGTPRTATYRITAPGGTWDNADNGTYTVQMKNLAVRDTNNNYVATGNLGTFLVSVTETERPTASLSVTNITGGGGTTHDVTVTYTDNVAIDVGSLDNNDILVTGPNSYSQSATFVSVNNTTNGTPRTATYRITAPGGTWDNADNGTYTVQMKNLAVRDTNNNYVATGNLGTFLVSVTETERPTASLSVTNITGGGGTTHDVTVTYTDNVAIDVGSLDNNDILVTGPNSYSQTATFVSVNNTTNGTPRTATYRITAPGGTWDSADNGTYTVQMKNLAVRDTNNNHVATGNLGTFLVSVTETERPTASLSVTNITGGGGTTHDVTVTYTDNVAIDVGSLDNNDILVTGPNSYSQTATFVSVNNTTNGTPRTATYRITAPGGTWDNADNGTYTVQMKNLAVRDTNNNYVAAGSLGTFLVSVTETERPTASLSVTNITSGGGTTHDVTVTYTDNVAIDVGSLDNNDILVTGPNSYSQTATFVSANNTTNGTPRTATYRITAPGGTWDNADNGTYTVQMKNLAVRDTNNNYVATGNLGTFLVSVTETERPTASLSVTNITGGGGTTHDVTVTYTDNVAIDVGSLDNNDILVTGPNSYSQTATFVSVNNTTNGTPRTATYRITAPGGTWDNADNGTYTVQMKNLAVRDTNNNYVAAGSLGTFLVSVTETERPTASLSVTNITSGGGTTHDVTVTYTDNVAIDVGSLDNNDILVTGPNSYSQTATFVSANNTTNGTPRTATYRITAPGGTWDNADNGTYTVQMKNLAVRDTNNNYVATGNLGTFLVSVTETERPTASLSVTNITGGGGTTHDVTVTYTDNVAIDVGSLDNNDILVTGPNSYSQTATFVSVNNTTNGTPRTATYRITAPGGTWDDADNGAYTVQMKNLAVRDVNNNYVATGSLGTFQVNVTETGRPTASLSVADITVSGGAAHDLTVTYTDNSAIDVSSLDNNDILVTGPNSYSQTATFVSVNNTTNGTPRTATYRITAPGGTWDDADNGAYTVQMKNLAVRDVNNNYLATGSLGTFQVNVTETGRPTASLSVADITVSGGAAHDLTVTYTDNSAIDVSSLDNNDILVTGPNGYSQTAMFVSVNNTTNGTPRTATYRITAPGGTWDDADNGAYTVQMKNLAVRDVNNNYVATGSLGTFQVNVTETGRPTASLSVTNVTGGGGTTHDFTVTYTDNVAIDVGSLDNNDILVTGPNSYSQTATFVSVNNSTNGTPRTATYRITAPGGTWDNADDGTYTVQMKNLAVRDVNNNYVATGTLGTFTVAISSMGSPEVIGTVPASGAILSAGPTEIVVHFSVPMSSDLGNLLPEDLRLQGTGLGSASVDTANWIDSQTAQFTITGTWGEGQVTVQLPGPWPFSAAGEALMPYSDGFFTITNNDVATLSVQAADSIKPEGNSGSTAFTFDVTRTGNTIGTVTVAWAVTGTGTNAANGGDFTGGTLPSGSLTFNDGETSKTISVLVVGDTTVEPHEQFTVTLSDASNAQIATATATGTILNDDGLPDLVISNLTVNSVADVIQYTITISNVGTASANLNVGLQNHLSADEIYGNSDDVAAGGRIISASNPPDVLGPGESLTMSYFAVGVVYPVTRPYLVVTVDSLNTLLESDETNNTIAVRYWNDTSEPSLAIAATDAVKLEGNSNSTEFIFTVTRSGATTGTATVDWAVAGSGINATNGTDFVGGTVPSGSLTFNDGETSKTITVLVVGDTTVEPDEGFTVTLSNASNAQITTATATGTIMNDDTALAIAATDAVKEEGNSGLTPFVFTVTRSGLTTGTTTVDWGIGSGGANSANLIDFDLGTVLGGTLTFNPGETSKTIIVEVVGDTIVEPNEGFTVTLFNASNAQIITAEAMGTILNDDVGLAIGAADAVRAEGNSGSTPFTFTVTRSGLTTGTTTVNWAVTGSGTNPANGADFIGGTLPSGTLTFAAGETTKTITVHVAGDTLGESDEGFTVTLSGASNAQITAATATGTILNDDIALAIVCVTPEIAEGDSGSTACTFTVTRSGLISGTTTVNWTASGSGINPANSADFVGGTLPSGTLTFNAGETSKTLTVNVAGDTIVEPDETLTVTLTSASNGHIATPSATCTILNDDTALAISATDAVKPEGHSGSTPFIFTVVRTGLTSGVTSFTWKVTGSGPNPADSADFVGDVWAAVMTTFNPGETSKTITVNVAGDTTVEPDEEFTVTLLSASNGEIVTTSATGTILNDDTALAVFATDAVKPEGNSDSTPYLFTVTRTGLTTGATTVHWAVTGSGTHPANAADFVGGVLPSGMLTFNPGETTKTITVLVAGDTTVEPDEGFTVTLSNASNAQITTGTATGTILTDDTPATTLTVTSLDVTASGFAVSFSQAFDPAQLNLYQGAGASLSVPDILVVGNSVGAVAGTVIVDPSNEQFTFIRTGSPLASDTYTVTLRSAVDGFVTAAGQLLDGDSNDQPGGNYVGSFTVLASPANAVTVSLPDFMRGPGQDVHVPNGLSSGIPLRLSNADGVFAVDLHVTYDPALLSITGAALASGLPAGSTVTVNTSTPGRLVIGFASPTALPAGQTVFANLVATVPATAGYAAKNLLRIENLSINEDQIPAIADAAVHVSGYFGDTTGNGSYSSLDSSRLSRVVVGLDSGFSAFQLADPRIIGDITGNGSFSSLDTSRLSRAVVGFDAPDIPPVTIPSASIVQSGPDPKIRFSKDLVAEPGDTLVIPLEIDSIENLTANPLFALDVIVVFDPNVFTINTVTNGNVITNSGLNWLVQPNINNTAGYLVLGTSNDAGLGGTFLGTFVNLNVSVKANAPLGGSAINIVANAPFTALQTLANEGELSILPAPTNASDDPIDGLLTVVSSTTPPDLAVAAVDAVQEEGDSGTNPFTFAVTRSGDTTGVTTVDYAVTGSGPNPANAADFAGGALPSGTLTFNAGETSKTIEVLVAGDTTVEPDEGFAATLSNASNAQIVTATATGTIMNDDTALAIFCPNPTVVEGNSGSTQCVFTVTRSGVMTGTTTVNWTVVGSGSNPANAADFVGGTFPSGMLTFNAGETSKTIALNVASDTIVEPDETFTVLLSSPSNGHIVTPNATCTILNDDIALAIAATDAMKAEGDSGSTPFTFTVTRSGLTTGTTTVNWAVAGSGTNAANGTDFDGGTLPSGTVTFSAGETSKTITVHVAGDTTVEPDEGFTVTLSDPSNAQILTATATGTILTDDTALAIAATSAVKAEGHSGSTPFTFTVTRSGLTTGTTAVKWTVTGSGANPANGTDFVGGTLPSDTLTFNAGETSNVITVHVAGDTTVEPDEGFTVTLSDASNTEITIATATGTILNDDTALAIAATDALKAEGNSALIPFTFTVTRSGLTSDTTSVHWAVTSNGLHPADAADFADGMLPSGTLIFQPGETSQTITVNVAGDTIVEPDEGFTVTLSNASNAEIIVATASGTILDDDKFVRATVTIASGLNGGPVLDQGHQFSTSVTSLGDLDGDGVSDLVVGVPGDHTGGTFHGAVYVLLLNADGTVKSSMKLTSDTNGVPTLGYDERFGTSVASLGDVDGDGVPDLAVGAIRDNTGGTYRGAVYVLLLKTNGSVKSTVKLASDTNGIPTLADHDYFGTSVASLGDLDGDGVNDLAVGASGDNTGGWSRGAVYVLLMNANGTVKSSVKLASDTNGIPTLADYDYFGTSVASLGDLDGDGVNDLAVGASGDNTGGWSRGAVYVLLMNANGTVKSRVKLASDTNGAPPLADGDLFGTSVAFLGDLDGDGVIDLAVGANHDDTGGPIRGAVHVLMLNADGTVKSSVKLASDTNGVPTLPDYDYFGTSVASLGDLDGDGVTDLAVGSPARDTWSGAVHILFLNHGNQSPTISDVADVTVDEDTPTPPLSFTVGDIETAAADLVIGGSSSNPSLVPNGSIVFGGSGSNRTVTIYPAVNQFGVAMITLTVSDGQATASTSFVLTVNPVNDAPTLGIAASNAIMAEGHHGSTPFTFTVTRSGLTTGTTTVNWSVAGSGANAANGTDFVGGTLPSGTVTFNAGETSKTITVNVAGDTTVEPDEGFTVTLSNASNAQITAGTATGTILNDEITLAIAATDAMKAEGNSGSTPFTFTVTRSGLTTGTTTVNWAVAGSGTNAANGTDFVGGTLPSGTVTFNAGETTKTITVNVAGDTTVEPDEGFTVTLSNASNAQITTGTATGTILNDEITLAIAATDAVKAEGNSGSTPFTFTVTRSGLTTGTTTVNWAVAGSGTNAANGTDFVGGTLPSGTVTFNAGETSKTITVNVAGDTTVEPDEGFTVTLSNASNAQITAGTATGTILNDEITLAIAATDAMKAEGNSGSTPFTFTVTRSGLTTGTTTVNWAVAGSGTNAANGADFVGGTLPSGTVTFNTGETSKTITVNVAGDTTVEPNEGFTVTLSNASNAQITAATAAGTILNDDDEDDALAAMHGVNTGYPLQGGPLQVNASVAYPDGATLLSLLWQPTLPAGWTLASVTGPGSPEIQGGEIVFTGGLPASPVSFSFTVNVPAGQSGSKQIVGQCEYQLAGMVNPVSVAADPNPLVVEPLTYHAADYRDPRWAIDGTEVNRVLSYWRAGGYLPNPEGADGYAPGSGSTGSAPRHSADYREPYWVIDGTELNRVLSYWRAGSYYANAQGADGYAPGSAPQGAAAEGESSAAATITHVTSSTQYTPGGTITVSGQVAYEGTPLSLLWRPNLPTGWTFASVTGDGTIEVVAGEIVWTGALPSSPVNVQYVLQVPADASGPQQLRSQVETLFAGQINPQEEYAAPDPLNLSLYQPDYNIFTIDSTGDAADANPGDGVCAAVGGGCTLRAAIEEANARANLAGGADQIAFNIAGSGLQTIQPLSALPAITDPVVIDATTQPGYAGTPLIELDGSLAGAGVSGLRLSTGGNTVKGLAINRFAASGILVLTGGENTIQGNFLGTDAAGTAAAPNAASGIDVRTAGNLIGGAGSGEGNLISGNANFGILLLGGAAENTIVANRIGTDQTGTAAIGNALYGIYVTSPGNQIGGPAAGDGNLISGNLRGGVAITGATATGNVVRGNRVGTTADGNAALPNGNAGITVSNVSGNTIGGTAAGAGNVLSGNALHGAMIVGAASTNNVVQGNLVGLNAAGTAAVPNGQYGITNYSPTSMIGGPAAGAGNTVSGNNYSGVLVYTPTATEVKVQGNRIGTNAAGTAAVPNGFYGVYVNSTDNLIGGAAAGEGNLISGNTRGGVALTERTAQRNVVQGNRIGTNPAGTAALANGGSGVTIAEGSNNTIGGTAAGAGNQISGNAAQGVIVVGVNATGNAVLGNLVGTNGAGTAAVANGQYGVAVYSSNTTIGGAGSGNTISGNAGGGVIVYGTTVTGTTVQGNRIGTDATGSLAVANGGHGVFVVASNSLIGGSATGEGNVIGWNASSGVYVAGATSAGNAIRQNSIYRNGFWGIDVAPWGPTTNDPEDPDTGTNNGQNFPEMASAVLSNGTLSITYSVPSATVNSAYPLAVEFFLADADGQEGQTYVGTHSYTSPGAAAASFAQCCIPLGVRIVATATDANGNTSEFSSSVVVSAALSAPAKRDSGSNTTALDTDVLEPLVWQAIAAWELAGLDAARVASLHTVTFEIADLPGRYLAWATPDRIVLDIDAAGYGWYTAEPSEVPSSEMDLLTAVLHEMGHVLGLADLDDEDELMSSVLQPGTRQLPTVNDVDRILAGGDW
jgi:CSLREA domain-containing protein